ncbi:hypothetical protein [Sulfitobacter sp.]|uniref:hypothetical protein n=1 Tax=Sulfitobacter sp. TaxID=1903071 RepID=UPI003EF5B3EE
MIKHDDLTQNVKTTAHELGEDVKEALHTKADRAASDMSDRVADRATKAANAADAAAAEFSADSLQARAAQQVADQVEGIASHLRTADLTTITRDVSDFARKNPALFIGGAALLGFAATRFLKARDPHRTDYGTAAADPWSSPAPTPRGSDVTS